MLYTTLNKILACRPCGLEPGCGGGFDKLLTYLGKTKADDEPLPFLTILESNGLDDAVWCCRSAPECDKEWRMFIAFCARRIEHLIKDQRSVDIPNVAKRYYNCDATDTELSAAIIATKFTTVAAAGISAGAAAGSTDGVAARVAVGDVIWQADMYGDWKFIWDDSRTAANAAIIDALEKEFKRIVS